MQLFLNYHNSSLNANFWHFFCYLDHLHYISCLLIQLGIQKMCTFGAISFFLISIISRELSLFCPFLVSCINPLCPTYIPFYYTAKASNPSLRTGLTLGNVSARTIPSHSGHPQYPGMYQLRSSNPNITLRPLRPKVNNQLQGSTLITLP